ncbi:Acetylornithine aminotransferase [Bacillus sp. THAF10]|uniref:aspartate aminotransferase family protein n=1 Tax=Bacillus sp. THAF10 TaxID=2587848 RepID=UPI001268F6B9|nr:aspartate aminotransferase family protein [Bacillus sp. THAF10]QFT89160.1 Acetylornithine aminotransferase [Bacillus sp. THAF10]
MLNTLNQHTSIMSTYNRLPLRVIKGKGAYVWAEDGEKYLDFTSGIATCNLGHCHSAVKNEINLQLEMIWHTSNLYEVPKQEELASLLTERSCLDQVFFCNSGAEANEAAIKLVKAHEQKSSGNAATIVTFHQSFHGRTLGTIAATGQEKIKQGFEPLLEGFVHLPFNDGEALKAIEALKPSAVMLELLQGEGGVILADPIWVKALASICKKQNTLLVVDEVQTGIGRTGSLFLYEQYSIEPDIITLAKGLGSGFPIGAMLAKKEVASAFKPGMHGSTFGGNPLACSAGIGTLSVMTQEFLDNTKKVSELLFQELQQLAKKFPTIKAIKGKGFLLGLEMEEDVSSFLLEALQQKLLLLSAGPFVIRMLPPINLVESEVHDFIHRFQQVLHNWEAAKND